MGNNMFNNCECDFDRPRRRWIGDYVLTILVVSLGVTLGLIIGANVAETLLSAMSALIVLAVMMGILIVIRFITLILRN